MIKIIENENGEFFCELYEDNTRFPNIKFSMKNFKMVPLVVEENESMIEAQVVNWMTNFIDNVNNPLQTRKAMETILENLYKF
jgi:hypothetical protein